MPQLTGHHHVAFTVSDLDASLDWYERVMGFVVLFREEGEARRACVMGFADGGFAVGLVQHGDGTGRFDPTRVGLDHAAFTVGSRDLMDDWAAWLDEHQVETSGVIEIPPGAILNFKDPDGIALSLFWDAP